MEIAPTNRIESVNCFHDEYSLILEEMEEDIENQMCKHIETYMCDMCNKTGILIYFVPMYIDWFENIIELKTEN